MKEVCFELATGWGTYYQLDTDDGDGNIPTKIKKKLFGGYEISFSHKQFKVHVHGVAYVKKGKLSEKPLEVVKQDVPSSKRNTKRTKAAQK